jgi:hypothetical protein
MHDPFDVWTAGKLRVACQIIHVENMHNGTLVDLVTLEACDRGLERIPAGTPLSLAFGIERSAESRVQLESIMTYWEAGSAVLRVEVEDVPGGLRYEFSCGDEQLILLVDTTA